MSPWHWLVVIAIAVLLFGARRLPDAARSLGRSARILKAELRDEPQAGGTGDGPDPSADDRSADGRSTDDRSAGQARRADRPSGT